MSVERDQSAGAQDLLSLFAGAVNIVDGTIGSGVGPGATVGFRYTNPIDGKPCTATGTTLTACPPPAITALRTADGKWFVVGKSFAKPIQERLLQLRQKRPNEVVATNAFVGYLYTQLLHVDTPVLCAYDPAHPPDPDDDLPPPDPDYPHPEQSYVKTWVHIETNPNIPEKAAQVERWFFGQGDAKNCRLNTQNHPPSSLAWLPEPPAESVYQNLYAITFLAFVQVLYEQPSLNAPTWTGYYQSVGKDGPRGFDELATLAGVAKSFPGDSGPDQPPPLWVYLGPAAGFSPYLFTYRLLANTSSKKCAPRLPAAPQPPTPPPQPANPADRKSYAIWYAASNLKSPLKLKTLSEQEVMGKGDIVYQSAKQTLVILKFGNAKNDGAPNTIDRGYCRYSIFKIPGDAGAPFTEIAMTWEIAGSGGSLSSLLQFGLGGHLFFQHLASLSFYADDVIGYLGGQANPLYARWIKAGTLRSSLQTCGSRHLRNLTKADVTGKSRVYVPDPFPSNARPLDKDWRGETLYRQAPFAVLKSVGKVLMPMQVLELAPNPSYDPQQPDSPLNRSVDLYIYRRLEIKKFEFTLKLAATESLLTIVCAPLDPRGLR